MRTFAIARRLALSLALAMLLFAPFTVINVASATDTFNQNRIIDDAIFDNSASMNAGQIDDFLNTFPDSCISSNSGFRAIDPTGYNPTQGYLYGDNVTAGQVIYDAAQAYNINPQVLITTLEKEQSLVTGRNNFSGYCNNGDQHKYAAAAGYGCPDSGTTYSYTGLNLYQRNGVTVSSTGTTCVNTSIKAGFSQQVIRAAWLFKFGEQRSEGNVSWAIIKGSWNNSDDPQSCYGEPMTQGTFARCPSGGATYYDGYTTIDNTAVHMDTGGTAALYWYTPHFNGNQNFFSLYASWFGNPTYPPSPAYIPDGTYSLRGNGSGRYVDVAGGSTVNGAAVQLYDGNGSAAQKWTFTRDAEGYYTIQNVASGKVLDDPGASTTPGTKLQIWDGNQSCAQTWAAQLVGTSYELLNACSGLSLEATGGTGNGTRLQLATMNEGSSQVWSLIGLDAPVVANGYYNLQTSAGTVMDIPGGSTATGTKTQIFSSNGSGAQVWQAVRQASGLYQFLNPQSGKYLDVPGGSPGTRVQIYDGNNSCSQLWALKANGNGSYTVSSACSGESLDVSGDQVSTNGTLVDIWDTNGTDAQKWTLTAQTGIVSGALYNLQTTANMVLDIPGGATAAGTRLQIYSSNGSGAQVWQALKQPNGLYEFRNPQSGKYLDVVGAGTGAGTRVQLWDGNHTCAQQWTMTDNGDGSYGITSSCSNKKLDVYGGAVGTNATMVDIWDSNGTNAQEWKLSPQ